MVVDGTQRRRRHRMEQPPRLGRAGLGRGTQGVGITRVHRHPLRGMALGHQAYGLGRMRKLDMQSPRRHK